MHFAQFLKVQVALILIFLIACSDKEPAVSPPEEEPLRKIEAEKSSTDSIENQILEPWTGDFKGMVKRRVVRMLVPHNYLFYFLDGAKEEGILAEAAKALEDTINKRLNDKVRKVYVKLIPYPKHKFIEALNKGIGDVAAGGISITDKRKETVDFTVTTYDQADEVLVTNPSFPKLNNIEELAGKTVYVQKSKSYFDSLADLNRKFIKKNLKPITVETLDDNLEEQSILEMLQSGVFDATVMDAYLVNAWSQVFNKVKIHHDLVVNRRSLAWAIRKDSPNLKTVLNDFIPRHKKGTTFGNIIFKRYIKENKWIAGDQESIEQGKLTKVIKYFNKYGEEYDIDPLLLAALAYQESKLNHKLKSRAGAVGIMQLMPRTGKAMEVGDINKIDSNIHASAKYLSQLREQYFPEDEIDELNKMLLTLASYNAGPTRIKRIRQETAKQGLDPNKWFDNVEILVARQVGREPIFYVSNIFKYYVSYRIIHKKTA